MSQFDVAIVGGFYNLSWLASELSRQGWNVLYLDLYESLGRWPTEDVEGPFGFFSSETLNPYFVEKLNFEETYVSQDRGFVVWPQRGPLEFKSPLIHHQLLAPSHPELKINADFKERLTQATEAYYRQGLTSSFKNHSFEANWLEYLAHTLTQTEYSSYQDFKVSKWPLPLMNSFFVRSLSRRSLEHSHEWLKNQNIQGSHRTQILDFVLTEGKKLGGFELKGELSGIIKFQHLIWGLSSQETFFVSEKLGNTLFPQGGIDPEWVWSRYSFSISQNRETEQIPLHSVWINDLYAPWTHENLLIVQRTTRDELYDVWIKIPSTQRFNKDYLDYYALKISEIVKKKFENTQVVLAHCPQEYEYTYQQLGPSRFVQYSKEISKFRKWNDLKNVYFSSYETLESLNRESQYQDCLQLIENINKKLKSEKMKELE